MSRARDVADRAIVDDAVTLAKMASGTDGQIITYDASGNPSAVGPGTDGQVLTSTGAGSPPAFEAVASGDNYETHFYYVGKDNTPGPQSTVGTYQVSVNIEAGGDVHCNGVAPYNYESVTLIRYWGMAIQAITSSTSPRNLRFGYSISANGESNSGAHTLGLTTKASNQDFTASANTIVSFDLMGYGSAPYFENNLAANDIFSFIIDYTGNSEFRAIGVQVTYKLLT